MDPKTGEKKLMGEKYTDKPGEYEFNEVLKPYYADINYASNASNPDSQRIRSKTPAQLLDRFDPLPSDNI